MADSNTENRAMLKERDVIIIACVCAAIIVTLLIILVCFICRRRQANAKEYAEERESHPPPVNGSVSSKKPQAQTQPQVYNNIDGSADGLRNPRDVFSSSTVLRGGGREKYIDLEEHQDPSLQSQESGYSTGDTAKPKKVIYEVVV